MQKDMYEIMQGDQYAVSFSIKDKSGTVITDDELRDIEITVGPFTKHRPQVSYDAEQQMWEFPLTQQETFRMDGEEVPVQLRLAFNNGDVIGVTLKNIKITPSLSREVL